MTAINALILPSETHVFTDAACFLAGTTIVCGLGRKIVQLGADQVFLFCGDGSDGGRLYGRVRQLSDGHRRLAFAETVRLSPMGPQPFTAFLFGAGWGVAVEENGRTHELSPTSGNEIKTIGSDLHLDPTMIVKSGIALAEDQRQRTGVVAGWLDYTHIDGSGVRVETVRRWEPHRG